MQLNFKFLASQIFALQLSWKTSAISIFTDHKPCCSPNNQTEFLKPLKVLVAHEFENFKEIAAIQLFLTFSGLTSAKNPVPKLEIHKI